MTEANKTVFRRWIQEVWNEGREATIDELSSPQIVSYGLGDVDPVRHGPASFKPFWRTMRGAFSQLQVTIEDIIAEGDKVAGRVTLQAVHTGHHLGVPVSGKKIRVGGIMIVRFENGQVIAAWNSWDQLGLMRQIGALPTPLTDGFVRADQA